MRDYTEFIKTTAELNELPFMVVLRTLQVLDNLKIISIKNCKNGEDYVDIMES